MRSTPGRRGYPQHWFLATALAKTRHSATIPGRLNCIALEFAVERVSELTPTNPKGAQDLTQCFNCRTLQATFDETDVSAIKSGSLREFNLRNLAPQAK